MKWINHSKGPDKNKINILCFAYAGAGSGYFARWTKYFDETFQIIPIQYPFRDNRRAEPMPTSIQLLAQELVVESEELFRVPFVLFGHCMGAHVAYEVAHRVEEIYGEVAQMLFLSSALSPRNMEMISTLEYTEEKFLRHYGVADLISGWDIHYKNFFLPTLRADSLLCEDYRNKEVKKVSSPICLLYGNKDKELEPFERFVDWQNYSLQGIQSLCYEGDHFFVDRESEKVAKDIMAVLSGKAEK